MDEVLSFGHYFVLGCWLSLQVTLCYLAGHFRLPHVTCQCLNTSFVKPVLYQLLAHEPNEPVHCVTDLFPLSAFTLRVLLQAWCLLKQLLWKGPAKLRCSLRLCILLLWNICNWIVFSLFLLSQHLQISDLLQWKDSFGNSYGELKAERFCLIPCLPLRSAWTLRQVSAVWEGKIYPSCIFLLIHTWIPLSKRQVILLLASWVWNLVVITKKIYKRKLDAFLLSISLFWDTLLSFSTYLQWQSTFYIKYSILVLILKIKASTQTFSEQSR